MNELALRPLAGISLFSGVGMLDEGLRIMKPIPGFEGRYSASEDGRIFSHVSNKYLKPGASGGDGKYVHVSLGKGCSRNVHELILLTFVGPAPSGHVARHLDGNGRNNALSNLAWATQSENILDKNDHGTMVRGEFHHACAISDADVLELRRLRVQGMSYPKLGKRFGISKSQAHRIATGQNRKGATCG